MPQQDILFKSTAEYSVLSDLEKKIFNHFCSWSGSESQLVTSWYWGVSNEKVFKAVEQLIIMELLKVDQWGKIWASRINHE